LVAGCREAGYPSLNLNLISNFPGEDPGTIGETFTYLEGLVKDGFPLVFPNYFYHVFPGNEIYAGLDAWERTHGTKVYLKRWWTDENTFPARILMDASRDLPFHKAVEIYHEKFKHLFGLMKDNAPDFKYKLLFLKKQKLCDLILEDRLQTMEMVKEEEMFLPGKVST
jgi:hypothetical protein